MIIVKIKAGLGNQMFQYACGRAVSLKREDELKLDISSYQNQAVSDTPRAYRLQFFNIKAKIASVEESSSAHYPLGIFSKIQEIIQQKVFKKYFYIQIFYINIKKGAVVLFT
jgi:hypothetical protein